VIARFRRLLLRIHATLLLLAALGSAVATTIGRATGDGPFGFMQRDPLVWVGLIQAYLLMAIIAVLLALGSREENPRAARRLDHRLAADRLPPAVPAA
jgi:hypothetical protein